MAERDHYYGEGEKLSDPGNQSAPVVPSDTEPLAVVPRFLYIGVGGDVVMQGEGDTEPRTWRNVGDGSLIPFRPSHILETGTTATDILAIN